MNDPALLGLTELDNTPQRYRNTRSAGGRHCNPFGFETEERVLGGMQDAKYEAYHWYCTNWVDARYRVTCTAGHTGYMDLCYGHAAQFRHRMAGICPRCAWPPRAKELKEVMDRLMGEIPYAFGSERVAKHRRLEDARAEMNELTARGVIRTGAPLRLQEIS